MDLSLLDGLSFVCRPDCGLCCYAEPQVSPAERQQLLQILPEVEVVRRGKREFLAAHADGGACRLLRDHRCRAHRARPAPCREYPLTVHVGARLQATAVLSCPGVDLSGLERFPWRESGGAAKGFPAELAALRVRVDRSTARRLEASARRRRKVIRTLQAGDRWKEETEVREDLGRAMPWPTSSEFPVADPPLADEGMENLPLFFDGRDGPVALARAIGGWELLELRPEGGVARSLGVLPGPDRPPRLHPEAESVLRGYLRYWLARDALFGIVHLKMVASTGGTVSEWVDAELRTIGALVLARAEVRAKLRRGAVDRLSPAELLDGIRATDQDLLDRDGWGDRL